MPIWQERLKRMGTEDINRKVPVGATYYVAQILKGKCQRENKIR